MVIHSLADKGTARISPFERLGRGLVEIVDEMENALAQVLFAGKACATQEYTYEDAEPSLDLVEPGKRVWGYRRNGYGASGM